MKQTLLSLALIAALQSAHGQLIWDSSEITKTIQPTPDNKTHVGYRFTATNLGDTPIEITQIQTSCGCTKAEIEPKVIPPRSSASLVADVDPKEVPETSENNIVLIEKGGKQHTLTAKLVKVLPYSLNPREIAWTPEEGPVPKTLTLKLQPNERAKLLSAQLLSKKINLKTIEESPTQTTWELTPLPPFAGNSALKIQLSFGENHEETLWVRVSRTLPNTPPAQTIPPTINTPESQRELLKAHLEKAQAENTPTENPTDNPAKNTPENRLEEIEKRLEKIENLTRNKSEPDK